MKKKLLAVFVAVFLAIVAGLAILGREETKYDRSW